MNRITKNQVSMIDLEALAAALKCDLTSLNISGVADTIADHYVGENSELISAIISGYGDTVQARFNELIDIAKSLSTSNCHFIKSMDKGLRKFAKDALIHIYYILYKVEDHLTSGDVLEMEVMTLMYSLVGLLKDKKSTINRVADRSYTVVGGKEDDYFDEIIVATYTPLEQEAKESESSDSSNADTASENDEKEEDQSAGDGDANEGENESEGTSKA